jgi:hypothetical protein
MRSNFSPQCNTSSSPSTRNCATTVHTFNAGIFPSTTTQRHNLFFNRNCDKKLFTPVNNSKFRTTSIAQQLVTTGQQRHLSFNMPTLRQQQQISINNNCASTFHHRATTAAFFQQQLRNNFSRQSKNRIFPSTRNCIST